uniref:Tripartite motif containing 25 n=1 Tax=Echeneis naucrates TaxID=173247 RepID=A0A665UQR3_ECHNA
KAFILLLQSDFSLLGLEEELTCSICLSTFQCPVTIPCGHNFCQDCLLATWRDTYSCPQCRTHFPTKPELKKNTVLSTVVETFNLRSSKSEMSRMKEEKKVIRCDTCMEAEAAQTCLTCMASFCEEHLRPHRENPNFAVHQLSDLVSDLSERICPDHHKLMELFCSEHGRPICSLSLMMRAPPDEPLGRPRSFNSTVLTLDPRTAHKRITLTEEFTKASVSDGHTNYPDCPERFAVCSQVLTSKGFSRGRHYWEVKLSSNNFIGIGLAYGSIDRKGPTSRLGRNNQSWCVEWFNVKLSAWHNSSETVLANYSPKRVGVLLDCEGGMATFYSVADRAYPFHSFVFPFAEAVYPAFWLFSSGSSISLCKLVA